MGSIQHSRTGLSTRRRRSAGSLSTKRVFQNGWSSQLPTSAWHQWLNEPTIADAIMDRLLHGSHTLALKGESLRRAKHPA